MKKTARVWRRAWSGLMALVLVLALLPCTAGAEEQERQVIRVAFPTQEGMSYFAHSGKVTGYNYDYLEKISEYTGWEMDMWPIPTRTATRR